MRLHRASWAAQQAGGKQRHQVPIAGFIPGAYSRALDPPRGRAMNAIRLTVIASCLAIAAAAFAEEGHHWTYGGKTGPSRWSALEHEYEACGVGKTQSPIDIRTSKTHAADLPAIAFDYKPSPLRIIDNGHTVQVDYEPGSFISVADARYELVQFHFHHPSEEKVDGHGFPMVAHLVHKDAAGRLAVVAVPMVKGKDNPLVAALWKHVPAMKGQEASVDAISIDASDLLPAKRGYYTFEGSLTTPPCSEGVRWFVLKSPATLSAGEIAAFAKLYPMNARPVQPLHGREVASTR